MRKLLLTLLLLLFTSTSVGAMDVTVMWDANTESDLAGYKIHYKIDGPGPPYDVVIDVGNVTQYTVTGLPDSLNEGQRIRFVVTAYNIFGLESGYSEEPSIGAPDVVLNPTLQPASSQ